MKKNGIVASFLVIVSMVFGGIATTAAQENYSSSETHVASSSESIPSSSSSGVIPSSSIETVPSSTEVSEEPEPSTASSSVVVESESSVASTSESTGVSQTEPSTVVSIAESASGQTPIYRLYNPGLGKHLYTTDANEKKVLYEQHGWGYEGVGWYAPKSGKAVYRLYNPILKNHLYTTDTNEVKVLTSRQGWQSDNQGKAVFYSGGKISIYRLYNPVSARHHWTTDTNEYKVLPSHGWSQEGVKFSAVQIGKPIQTQYKVDESNHFYQPVLNRYSWYLKNAKRANVSFTDYSNMYSKHGDYGIPGFLPSITSPKVFYAFYDIDKNGVNELLLSTSTEGVHSIYGLKNNTPAQLIFSEIRFFLSIYEDGSVIQFGLWSRGSHFTRYQFKNGIFQMIQEKTVVGSNINPFDMSHTRHISIQNLQWNEIK